MEAADVLVEGLLLTGDPGAPLLFDGCVVVGDGRILAVGAKQELETRYSVTRHLGGRHSLVHPGLIDCHQHASQALVRSLIAHELPMIYRIYIPIEAALDESDVQLSTRLLQAQLLRSGVTTFAETTVDRSHENPILETISEVGMRCSVGRGRGDQEFHHASLYSQARERSWARHLAQETFSDLQDTVALIDDLARRRDPRLKPAVVATHLTRASEEYFRAAHELARERNLSLQVHVARDREEVEFCLAVFGCRPVERLQQLEVIDEHLLAIHAIMCTDREILHLAAGQAAVAHQPIEALHILNGLPPVRQMLDAGITVGLGCDNAINDGHEMMRAAWLLHTATGGMHDYDAEHLPASTIFSMATMGGARALRWQDEIGSLEPGKQADLVIVDLDRPHMVPLHDPISDLVRYGSRAEVTHVMVAGRLLVEGGLCTTIDEERLLADVREAAPRIAAVAKPLRYRPL